LQVGVILKSARSPAAIQIVNIDGSGCRLQYRPFAHNDRALIVSGLPSEF
jgi:hypothetical protein